MNVVKKMGYEIVIKEEMRELTDSKVWWKDTNVILTGFASLFWIAGIITSILSVDESFVTPLLLISTVLAGFLTAKAGFNALKNKMPLDMNVLMVIAVVGAVLLREYFEAATVAVLFNIGNTLELYAMDKTRQSIRSLMDLSPDVATILRNGKEVILNVKDVKLGDRLVIKPGSKIPLDAKVVSGSSSVNQAPITGESIPMEKNVSDVIYAGTINQEGYLEAKVIKESKDTTLAKIIELVEQAQSQKAPSERFIDTFAKYYTPIVISVAVFIAIIPPLFLNYDFNEWFYRAIALLVVSCPCALVISTPVSIVSALGNAAKNGVLIKGGAYLERAGKINALAFDKTGTLTEGNPKVTSVISLIRNITENEIIELAASVESKSEHPLAKAIVSYAQEEKIDLLQTENFKSFTGIGVVGYIDEDVIKITNPEYAYENLNIEKNTQEKIRKLQDNGQTVMTVIKNSVLVGYISVADKIRPEAKRTILELKKNNYNQLIMLTGDNKATAKNISDQLGIDKFFAELLPDQKLEVIKKLKQDYDTVAMIGDGVNDAPALALADIGISLGSAGTDTAIETADIVLMSDDLSKLSYAMNLSKRALKIIKQNVMFSLLVKFAAVLLVFPGLLTLWIAVLADTGAALVVIFNGMRLLQTKKG
ncbi:MAG: heavy metal translocating P-type ATPase [Clostridia bacterium]